MPRPDRSRERRAELLPILAEAFVELGYRKATTAELARRCGLRENQLYRLWADKKAMFIAAIEWIFEIAQTRWREVIEAEGARDASAAQRLLDYECRHHGESGVYRIIFAALSETDDPDVRAALKRMYARFHKMVTGLIEQHRGDADDSDIPPSLAAWSIIGGATMLEIMLELKLANAADRRGALAAVGRRMLD